MASILVSAKFQAFDSDGNPLAGGKVYTYEAGTTTPKVSYTTAAATVPNANPVILDASGRADIWLDGTYQIKVFDSADNLIYTTDNVSNDRGEQGDQGTIPVAAAGGSADAITADFDTDVTLTDKTLVAVRAASDNATTTPTFAPDGLTARTITKDGGDALVAGDIQAGSTIILQYDLANTRWVLANPSTSTKQNVLSGASLTAVTVAADDKVVIQDTSDSDNLKTVTTQSIATLYTGTTLTNSLSGNVALNNTSNYFTGPTVAQGTSGTWLATGHVTVYDSTGGAAIYAKLWDGTTVISSSYIIVPSGNFACNIHLAGVITNPAGNIRISCRDASFTTGTILADGTGEGKDSTVTVVRIG